MPKLNHKQPELVFKKAKSKEADYKIPDEDGLFMLVSKSGSKIWRVRYKFQNKEQTYVIGKYPAITTAEARAEKDRIRKLLAKGENPNQVKALEAAKAAGEDNPNCFHSIAQDFFKNMVNWVPHHKSRVESAFERDVYPIIGKFDVREIKRTDTVKIADAIKARGSPNMAKQTCGHIEKIFDYAVDRGLIDNNPALRLSRLIKPPPVQNRKRLKIGQLPDFLKRLEAYHGHEYIKIGLQLLLLTFVRPGDVAGAKWEEFDLENRQWIVPEERVKIRVHGKLIVPLSSQSMQLIARLKEIGLKGEYLFPGVRANYKPISNVTFLKVLQTLGYAGETKIHPHGMRGTASTILNTKGFRKDVIEVQLHHSDKDKIRATYNAADYLEERVGMMQWWGDFLDRAKNGDLSLND